jgi:hypothetical protein
VKRIVNSGEYGFSLFIAAAIFVTFPGNGRAVPAQTWTATTAPAGLSTAWLLTDGRVMAQQYCTNHWWALAPDSSGNYSGSTWTQLADTPATFGPLYYASAVLADGRLVAMGGEYHAPGCAAGFSTLSYIYNPTTNIWTSLTPPAGWSGGDANSIVLATGEFVVADPVSEQIFSLNPSTLVWTSLPTTGKADANDEEGWTLLPSGKFLTVDAAIRSASEIYDPVAHTWTSAGSTVNNLSDALSEEVGPAVLMYNGTVFATGGGMHLTSTTLQNGHTDTYTVSSGTWAAGPDFPNPFDVSDGPASLLPNGNVLVVASPGTFGPGSHFYEYDGTHLNAVPATINAPGNPSFVYRLLLLPNGQVMSTDGSSDVEFYTPNPGFVGTAAPHISNSPSSLKPGNTYTLSGFQLNGLSQANAYGDDVQTATNYPLLEIKNDASSHVKFARTHDHSTMGVATGNTLVSTQFDVPVGTETGPSHLTVIANGIPSSAIATTVTACTPPVISSPSASPNSLWPPNNKLVNVTISYTTSTSSGCPVTSVLTVASNETDAKPEWIIVDAHHLQLVAGRDGNGSGRIYTITITATNAIGQVTTSTVEVVVPHDKGN